MVQHALDRRYEVVGMCRQQSLEKLEFNGRITVIAGATDDPEVIKRAVAGCGAVLAPSQWPCHTHSTSLLPDRRGHASPASQ